AAARGPERPVRRTTGAANEGLRKIEYAGRIAADEIAADGHRAEPARCAESAGAAGAADLCRIDGDRSAARAGAAHGADARGVAVAAEIAGAAAEAAGAAGGGDADRDVMCAADRGACGGGGADRAVRQDAVAAGAAGRCDVRGDQ